MKKLLALIVLLVSMNVSAQWQPDVRLTNDPGDSFGSFNNAWCVAANGNVVHVVWYDYRDGNPEIYYKRSTDGGITWGMDTRLTNNTGVSVSSTIVVSGSFVHVAWCDNRDDNKEIYYKRSTDGGISWGEDTRLTNNSSYSEFPSIAASGSNVHVVWKDLRDGNNEIYYKRSADNGANWGADIRMTNDSFASWYPSVAVSGSNVYVVWYDRRDGNAEIYYKHSTDGGITWGSDIRLTNNSAGSWAPTITVSGSNLHILWTDDRDGNYEIYYKRSIDGGINWGADTRLTNNNANSELPTISLSGSVVHVVWVDGREGNNEIYYKRSTDAGLSWQADTRLTYSSANSYLPSVAVSGSVVNIVWSDQRDGNWDIYYKRDPTGNVGIQNISTETPSKYSLSQNYPNPFNPTTKIRFDISLDSRFRGNDKVVLKVYDVMGREVQTLVNESLKPGTYETSFDGSMLNSGVYFYKLVTGNFTKTKKMLLIK